MSVLSQAHFHDEVAAFAFLEEAIWPNGPVCPHCDAMDRIGKIKANPEKRIRYGLHKCGHCKKQFRVTVGTVFEHARLPLFKVLQAAHLMCSSKKGISAHQLHRILEVQYKTAWFLSHRLREAMRSGALAPMGGEGAIVEVDETFIGQKEDVPKRRGYAHKHAVLSLVERGEHVRSFHVDGTTAAQLVPILRANIAKETAVMTDEAGQYGKLGDHFASHDFTVNSAKEYVRGEVHTNTVEGFYSIFKRGMKGIYQHCAEKHLHRYVAEFDFRYNNRVKLGCADVERTDRVLKGIVGKRLTYRAGIGLD
ncbi:MAG: IS1595 family transposase [Rhodospirillales bacterium]|nr:IS1595 family transposase [Acetobacter sp.]